jgi:glutathione synthase
MRIGFIVNDVKTEEAGFTTIRLAQEAMNRGHDAWLIGVGDLAYDPDDQVRCRATTVPKKKYKTSTTFHAELNSKNTIRERITLDDLDVVMLRNVPSDDVIKRPWAARSNLRVWRCGTA